MINPVSTPQITQVPFTDGFAVESAPIGDVSMGIAKRILAEVMAYRRVPEGASSCALGCANCDSLPLRKILAAVKKNETVSFVLPAFPGKSPNPEKVLGPLPDLAERLALKFLGTLCERIKDFYQPGIKIILCSDGRVFSDVVGMQESDVTAYQDELSKLIKEMSLSNISTFNLDDFYKNAHFVKMREELMQCFGQSLDFLKTRIRNGAQATASSVEKEANRMYSGITRFLFEDSMHAGQTKSRSAVQKDARARAYEVIRRSNAWSKLLFEHFPEAVRLSIHPQTCGSKKLGIRLIGNESWMTPWHGVAVETKKGFILLKRSEAESLGANLVCSPDGRPSHFQLGA